MCKRCFADSLDDAGRAKHPDRHPVFVELGDGGVEQVRDELPPGRLPPQLLLLRGVLRLLLPVLRHDVLAVHCVVEPVPGIDVPRQVFQLVPVRRQDSLKWVTYDHEAECVLGEKG